MDYKSVIESKYNRENWQALLHDIFGNKVEFYTYTTEIDVNKDIARKALYLGKISLTDGKTIGVYEVELNDRVHIESNKVAIRNLLTSDWRMNGFAGAFMFCFKKDESILRFSYVSEVWGFNEEGKYEKQSTNTKRFTYLLGEGHGGRTAIDQFKSLKSSALTLDDITKAFSVDVLTKQFYNDLFDWYLWAIDPESNVTFPGDTSTPDDDREDLETKIIRMITRIMFVWFIKQKQLVPDKIFDIEYLCTILKDFDALSTTKGEYYNAILQNLFFATLNRAIIDEDGSTRQFSHAVGKDVKNKYRYAELFSVSEQEVIDIFSTVPFVNGGLFECLDKTKTLDGVEKAFYYDGFSRNDNKFANGRYRNRAIVPNVLFFEPEKGLFSILKRYNFTIEENSPEEQQVALDPELLGKVFENLLGAYNPETQESARNSSGSFYTPREIVNYMVDESLVQYLGDTPVVRSLFADEFTPDEAQRDAYNDIARRLKTIKILDPACGSGAFPMGALKRIVEVLKRINPEESDYKLKLAIIENCIYGSDIQCIAAQITKLRFFISLICECDRDENKPNFGIPVLPNLETKFVAANSLLALKRREAVQLNVFDDTPRLIVESRAKLTEVRHQHFMAKSASTKRRLRDRDAQLRQELSELLSTGHAIDTNDAQQLASWNPYDQNAVANFFDPEWMFGIADGFDIVIGNPPYIQLQKDGGSYAKLYENCNYQTFARTGDIYCLFYERGWQLLKEGGHLCYITSNKWMRAGYGEKTREFFAKKTNPMLLIDFAGVKIFESATVDTNILLFAKSQNKHETVCAVTNKQNKDSVKNLSVFVQQQHSINSFSSSDSWVILSEIEQSIKRKIEAVGTPLKDWDIQIYRGVLTGYNEAFIISTEKRNEILANCQSEQERAKTEELIRPILRGRDIKRYGYDWAGLWLINTHNGVKGVMPRIDIDDYPAVKQHLDKYWDKISKRADKGDTPYNLRNCAYVDDFSKPKIVWGNLNLRASFAMALDNSFVNAPSPMIVPASKYLLGMLNSKIADYYIRNLGVTRNGGYFEYKPMFVEQLPVPSISEFSSIIENLVEQKDEKRIDETAYEIYGLTQEEIDYVESVLNQ